MQYGDDIEKFKRKRYYRLWREYLKRSDEYKEFCEYMRRKREDSSIPVPEKFKKDGIYAPPIVPVFLTFHDVYVYGFDEWWEVQGKWLMDDRPTGLYEFSEEFFKKTFDQLINSFEKNEGREPTLRELRDNFLEFATFNNRVLPVMVSPNTKLETLVKALKEVIRPYRSLRRKRIVWDELERYLIVYDLKAGEKLKWREVIPRAQKATRDRSDRSLRAWQRDLQKARAIIRNAERGIFPGHY